MVGLMNSFAVFASGTGLFPVVGSTGLFGWFLLLPPMEFSQFQEPATIASVAHPLPVEAGACGLLLPPSSPSDRLLSGAAVCQWGGCPWVGWQRREAARVDGTASTGRNQYWQSRRFSGRVGGFDRARRASASAHTSSSIDRGAATCRRCSACPSRFLTLERFPARAERFTGGRPHDSAVSTAQSVAHVARCGRSRTTARRSAIRSPATSPSATIHPQNVYPQAGHTLHVYPPHVPPHVQMQQGHPQAGQLPVPGQWSEQAGPIMIQPQVVPNHFVVPRGPQGRMVESTGPSFPFQQMTSPSATHPSAIRPTHPPAMGPQHGPVPSHQVPNHDGPVRLSFSDQPNDHGPRNMYRPDMYMQRTCRHAPTGHGTSDRTSRSHRVRQAARRLEEAAWELEEVGEYELADDVRRQANQLYHRARGESLRLQSR
jgi:hypothetical protein